jgi:hypothetical protein
MPILSDDQTGVLDWCAVYGTPMHTRTCGMCSRQFRAPEDSTRDCCTECAASQDQIPPELPADAPKREPYGHYCSCCILVGRVIITEPGRKGDYDCYLHLDDRSGGTLIARASDEAGDYRSGTAFAKICFGTSKENPLRAAYLFARERIWEHVKKIGMPMEDWFG